jgi:FMN phosphatase YigB (HAD superfamily)
VTLLCPIVFLLDVDNTLLDDDGIHRDLADQLERELGVASRNHYSRILEDLFAEQGYRDYAGALQRYRMEHPPEVELLSLSSFLIDYPFGDRLFPAALDVVKRLGKLAPTVILSEGDVVFQARKLERAGLCDAAEGRVLIYTRRETLLYDIERLYPAEHYVLVDDKLSVLEAVKKSWGKRVTTVFARQGRHAGESKALRALPLADATITGIDDLLGDLPRLWTAPQLIPRIKAHEMPVLAAAE